MSKQNKVNPDHYHTGGRLTPDDLAREQAKQQAAMTRERQEESGFPGAAQHVEDVAQEKGERAADDEER